MKEVIRSADPRIAALIERQATQYVGRDFLGLDRIAALNYEVATQRIELGPIDKPWTAWRAARRVG